MVVDERAIIVQLRWVLWSKRARSKSTRYHIEAYNISFSDTYCVWAACDFYRGWDDYKRGFGNLNGEFWLGLDKIHRLSKERSRLHVDLEDTTGKTAYAEYDFFGVTSERSKYKLSLGTYSGKLYHKIRASQTLI